MDVEHASARARCRRARIIRVAGTSQQPVEGCEHPSFLPSDTLSVDLLQTEDVGVEPLEDGSGGGWGPGAPPPRGPLLRCLGEQQDARHRHGVLERHAHDLGRVDDAGLDQVDVLVAGGVEAEIALALEHPRAPRRRRRRPSSRRSAAPGASSARFRICTPVRSSPSHVCSSFASASMHRSSARPPPGTMPSATAALVALIASSSASFLDFISDSDGAPTRITATPPASLASRSCSFSRS